MTWEDQLVEINELTNSNNGSIDLNDFRHILKKLPYYYQSDQIFRLRFENAFPNGLTKSEDLSLNDPLLSPLAKVIEGLANNKKICSRSYNFTNLFCYHVQSDLKGRSFLEVGGCQSKELIIDLFGASSFVSIDPNQSRFNSDSEDINYQTIGSFIEEIDLSQITKRFDRVFSISCFEHIKDLPKALINISELMSEESLLYSYFAPIFSHYRLGDHGRIDRDLIPNSRAREGLHLLSLKDQRKRLLDLGITNSIETRKILSEMNLSDYINRNTMDEYLVFLTESPLVVLRLDRIQELNASKMNPPIFKLVRESNPHLFDITTLGVRTILSKYNNSYMKYKYIQNRA